MIGLMRFPLVIGLRNGVAAHYEQEFRIGKLNESMNPNALFVIRLPNNMVICDRFIDVLL